MTIYLEAVLESSISDRKLLSHPFYRRWESGGLSIDELRLYAEQYRYFEEMLPHFLEQLAMELPEGFARESVLKNLADEVAVPSHLELFERFAQFYQASDAPISPAMERLVDAYQEILEQGPSGALAGLWAYESQGAGIADSKAEGLATHYGASRESLDFWLAHGTIEEDHAKWTLEALQLLEPDEESAREATRLIAAAWWEFLDERELVAS
jgi:pyrroloquinoline quinone (PQQ) biosynthesis protein C